jgi:D-alanyl-D-alanine carboxypeptidase
VNNHAAGADLLDAFIERQMQADGTPGVAVALTDREGLLRVATYGLADIAAGTPVAPGTLFPLGSIGKVFTAVAILQLSEARALDLHAPVDRYLPWFHVGGAVAPITPHHLLSHTAGIVAGMDAAPDAVSEVWALRELALGSAPGEHFHYSNVGFKALGLIIEQLTGEPYGDAIRHRILIPLEMEASEPVLTHAIRPKLAVGYAPLYDDRPPWRDDPLVPAPWVETATGDGCLAAPAADVASFLRMLLNRGGGPNVRLLSADSVARMTTPVIEGWGVGHGYGLFIDQVDGRTEIDRPGFVPGYGAWMRGDLDEGLGAVVLMNGPGSPFTIAGYALELLRAAQSGRRPPLAPPVPEATAVPDAAAYAGTYHAFDDAGAAVPIFELTADDGNLIMRVDGDHIRLAPCGEDVFAVPHPAFARFRLRFGRVENQVVEAFHGGTWYASTRFSGRRDWTFPAVWTAYLGHYRAHNPWIPNFRIVARKDELWLVFPVAPDGFDEEQPLIPLESDPAAFRVGADPRGPERIRFEVLIDGRAQRATLSGCPYFRFFTP